MHTVRTTISFSLQSGFRRYLNANNMAEMILGSYQDDTYRKFICYAYSDRSTELTLDMTALILIHGSLQEAFLKSKYAKQSYYY